MEVLYCLLIIVAICGISVLCATNAKNNPPTNHSPQCTMRCPNCGSPATIHGSSWECGWCGDCGSISYRNK